MLFSTITRCPVIFLYPYELLTKQFQDRKPGGSNEEIHTLLSIYSQNILL
uniref:Uncharacterized protein n=1 Tax=Octopus bimaculoides TaxID=37653 RepID=A0A0L8I9U1_OCTBM